MKIRKTLTEDKEFNPLAYLEDLPKFTEQFAHDIQSLVGNLAIVSVDNSRKYTSILRLDAPSNDYISGGIINVTEKLIDAIRSEVENAFPGYTVRHNNTATAFWIDKQ